MSFSERIRQFLILFLTVQCVSCGFIDFTDLEDPFAIIWQNKESWLQQPLDESCMGTKKDGLKLPGLCKRTSKCILSGGVPSGLCGGLLTCCTYDSICGKITKAKVSYFDNGDRFDNNIKECKYTVQLANSNICQVRLDFDRFETLPATLSVDKTQIRCTDDQLVISPNNYGIPVLCGHNTQQHVYIHINQTEGEKSDVTLNFQFKERNNDPSLIDPTWKIKVTQLECPGYDKHSWIHYDHKQAIHDFPALAPTGAIQYFTDATGFIRSFGYNPVGKKNSFTTGEKYAIAFRKRKSACGLLFTKDYFNLHYTPATPPGPSPTPSDTPRDNDCEDYLFVPELKFEPELSPTAIAKVCATNVEPKKLVFTSTPPGPQYVYFTSPEKYKAETNLKSAWAFNIKYNLYAGC